MWFILWLTYLPTSQVSVFPIADTHIFPIESYPIIASLLLFNKYNSNISSIKENGLTVGDRVIVSSGFGSRPGILRYLGETQFASGNWCGIELDEGTGKNDGSVDGIR